MLAAEKYGSLGLALVSLSVSTKDLLSGFQSTVKVDLVYVRHPSLCHSDFDVNCLQYVVRTPHFVESDAEIVPCFSDSVSFLLGG